MTAVTYRLQPSGRPVLPRIPEAPCCWCAAAAHRDPPPGSACPVRLVEAAEVLPPDAPRWLVAERGASADGNAANGNGTPRGGGLKVAQRDAPDSAGSHAPPQDLKRSEGDGS